MKMDDFRVSGDTILWIIISLLVLWSLVTYNMGYEKGVMDEKIGWLEDQQLKEIENEQRK